MPFCGKCALVFPPDRAIQGIRLTRLCEECIASEQVVNKTSALAMGARPRDLEALGHRRMASRRSGVSTYLFLKQEVEHVAAIASADRREKDARKRAKVEAQAATKKARQEDRERSLEKRTRLFLSQMQDPAKDPVLPTPGLVSGDFCSSSVKTPVVSVGGLCKRVILWRTLDAFSLPHRVTLFSFACERKNSFLLRRQEIDSLLGDYLRSLDTVVLGEGHRILTFLSPMERLHALRAMPCAEQELYGLPVADMSDDMYALCVHAKKELVKMQTEAPVLRKLMLGEATAGVTASSWEAVHSMLISRSGPVIPGRIGYYGVSRVFDMLRDESPRSKRKGKVTECVSRTGPFAPSFTLMEVLKLEYIDSPRLADFEGIEHVVRIFNGRRTAGPSLLNKFRLLRAKMGVLVYEGGQTWAEATQEAYDTLFFDCACGNSAAKFCVLRKCRVCCHGEIGSGACLRHRKGLGGLEM